MPGKSLSRRSEFLCVRRLSNYVYAVIIQLITDLPEMYARSICGGFFQVLGRDSDNSRLNITRRDGETVCVVSITIEPTSVSSGLAAFCFGRVGARTEAALPCSALGSLNK